MYRFARSLVCRQVKAAYRNHDTVFFDRQEDQVLDRGMLTEQTLESGKINALSVQLDLFIDS
ncbi:hypothetical protein SB759_32610, partial [Pseudomonas sp. SIMBA_059]